jgi:hypothetical protein
MLQMESTTTTMEILVEEAINKCVDPKMFDRDLTHNEILVEIEDKLNNMEEIDMFKCVQGPSAVMKSIRNSGGSFVDVMAMIVKYAKLLYINDDLTTVKHLPMLTQNWFNSLYTNSNQK